jgi:hypothetical protein
MKSISTSTFQKDEAPAPPAQPEPVAESEDGSQDEPSGEGNTDADPADSPRKSKRDPRWVKERIERVRRVTAAETREQMLREFAERQQPQREPEPASPEAKTRADFDFDDAKYTAYLVEQELGRREQQRQAEKVAKTQAEATEQFKAKVDAFEEVKGAGAWEDIETSPLNTDPKFKPLVDLFMGDDHDLEIAHHLATNDGEAERLMALSPVQRAREITKLADRFGGEQQAPPAPVPQRKTTNAPPPPKTISGSGKSVLNVDSPDISPADRIKAWKQMGVLR